MPDGSGRPTERRREAAEALRLLLERLEPLEALEVLDLALRSLTTVSGSAEGWADVREAATRARTGIARGLGSLRLREGVKP